MSQLVTLLEIGLTNHIYFDSNGLTEHTNHLRASFSFQKKLKHEAQRTVGKFPSWRSLKKIQYVTIRFKNYTLFYF